MSNSYTGSEALVLGALDSGISLITGVPGYPISGIMELLMDSPIEARWSVNEKVALEAALGASATGRRALVVVKHVGMNVLADPLITSATHTIGAGVVIVAGDDPGAMQSQNEQDSRYYGLLAEVPVLDPDSPQSAYTCMHRAFTLSEKVHMPVVIRVTGRLNDMNRVVDRTPGIQRDYPLFDRDTWSFTLRGKHQQFHKESYPVMEDDSIGSEMNVLHERGKKIGIISSGFVSALVEDVIASEYPEISHLALTHVNPLPAPVIEDFIRQHSRVLVAEETEPVIELQLACCGVLGKRTSHLGYGRVEDSDIRFALEHIERDTVESSISPETIKSRGYSKSICDDCPYRSLYDVLGGLDMPVAGDLGCSVRTAPPPMEVVDIAYSLGSSIAAATGFERKGIALIGDYGLVHTGLQGLIEAVYNKKDVLAIVLQNEIAALTGGQSVPDMTAVIKSLVPGAIILDVENTDKGQMLGLIEAELGNRGVSVILARGPCRMYKD